MTTDGVPTSAHIFEEPTKLLRGLPDFCPQLNSAKNFEGHTQVMPAAWFKPGAPAGMRGSPGFLLFPFNLTESYEALFFPLSLSPGYQEHFLAQCNMKLKKELQAQNLPNTLLPILLPAKE